MGRSRWTFLANEIGAPFPEIKSFAAYVGGCPITLGWHVSIGFALGINGSRRIRLEILCFTFLIEKGVVTKLIPRKPRTYERGHPGYRTTR